MQTFLLIIFMAVLSSMLSGRPLFKVKQTSFLPSSSHNLLTSWKKSLLISKIKNRCYAEKNRSISPLFHFLSAPDRQIFGSLDIGWRRIMGTRTPKFTFLGQKGTDFPNLGTHISTVTFSSSKKASKGHKKAKKITAALLKGDGARPKLKDLGIF